MTFVLSLFVFLLQFLWKQIEQIIGKGLGADVILELVLYACATLVPMALPLALLLASIMTLGNFGEKYEKNYFCCFGYGAHTFSGKCICRKFRDYY